jgi:1-acyl-sn-glycerol-3-phosphate acyltransferase
MAEKKTAHTPARRGAKARKSGKARLPLNGHSRDEVTLDEEVVVKPKRREKPPTAKAAPAPESARPKRRSPARGAEPGRGKRGAKPMTEADIDPSLRRQLMKELEEMIGRVRALHPGYTPPPFSPQGLLQLLEEGTDRLPAGLGLGLLEKLKGTLGEDLLDVDTWKGMWYVLNSSLQYQADGVKRRATGEYETDEWGLDREFLDAVRPFFEFMYKTYWRVEMSGLENVPEEGRALLVVNHSGQLPWDGAMVASGVLLEHPNQRLVRTLYATWFPTLPFFSDILVKCGQVLATEDNGLRLLEQDELVAVYPEGYKGVGKLYKERYRLARFGRGGFVRMGLKAHAPLIPVAVVGAEETYISLSKSNTLARLTGFPYFPISPTWPWLGLLGFVPLPTKWYIDIGEPIPTTRYRPGSENNLVLVSQLTDQVRNVVQEMIFARLAKRRSVFWG